MKGLLQSEVRYHPSMQEPSQLLHPVVSSNVSPAITHGGGGTHTAPETRTH